MRSCDFKGDNTWKNVMKMQDKVSENCTKWILAYKENWSKLDKGLSFIFKKVESV